MRSTPRDELGYDEADVAEATRRLRIICTGLPDVSERMSHGAVAFFVRDRRALAYLQDDHHGDGRLALVCAAPPGAQGDLVRQEPDRFFRPPYVGHRGWLGVRLDVDPDWDEIGAIVEQAYRLVAPAALVRRLDGGP